MPRNRSSTSSRINNVKGTAFNLGALRGASRQTMRGNEVKEEVVVNFSLPVAARGNTWRRMDWDSIIQPQDTPEVIQLKNRIMAMALEEAQILRQPNEYSSTTNAAKISFRIEFEGILACLELRWHSWEADCLYTTIPFAENTRHRIMGVHRLVDFQEVSDGELQERIEMMNRYHREVNRQGATREREARERDAREREVVERIGREMEEVRRAGDGWGRGRKGFGFSSLSKRMDEKKKAMQGAWEGGDTGLFDFGFEATGMV